MNNARNLSAVVRADQHVDGGCHCVLVAQRSPSLTPNVARGERLGQLMPSSEDQSCPLGCHSLTGRIKTVGVTKKVLGPPKRTAHRRFVHFEAPALDQLEQ